MSVNKKLIIFDFDGVLADSFYTFYPLIRDGMRHIGKRLTPEQYRSFFMGNVHKGFKEFIKNDSDYEEFSKFRIKNYDKYYYNNKSGAKLFQGAQIFIKNASKKYILTIASSGKQKNIKHLLKKVSADKSFGLILADSKHSKDDMISKILRKYKPDLKETLFITDTVGDVIAAKGRRLNTIAVTWGFQSKKALIKSMPDNIVSSFDQLKKLIDKL